MLESIIGQKNLFERLILVLLSNRIMLLEGLPGLAKTRAIKSLANELVNGQPFPSIGSLDDLEYNDDGSIDLYFAPELPAGVQENNWLKTVPGKGWFTLLRLYSPTQTFFDQTWKPGDFEKIK
jgi:hypothetical protein